MSTGTMHMGGFVAAGAARPGVCPAAILAKENILKVETVDFEDLGMEAIRKIEVKDFPAFIVMDDKGNDFFEAIREGA